FPRLVRIIRLLKFLRILQLSRKMAKVDLSAYIKHSVVRLIQLLGYIIFVAHLIGCTWFLVDECDPDNDDDPWVQCGGEGLGSK
ncbi:unnamed protein product, partial [Discosporangium mesarthrocarpum]